VSPIVTERERRGAGGPLDAVRLLTVVPAGRGRVEGVRGGVGFFALVGWALGAVPVGLIAGASAAGIDLERNGLLVAAGVVLVWAGLTRLLHWDGLADTADGLLGGRTHERRLEIMRDSRTGAFGAAAVALVAAAQVGAASSLVEGGIVWPFLAAPVLARAAASVTLWTVKPARGGGLASSISDRATAGGILATAVACGSLVPAVAFVDAGRLGGFDLVGSFLSVPAISMAVSGAVLVVLFRTLARPVGGITGDTLGAGILLGESLVLASAALVG
jgi:adenosylcobinamide-GDP ribazoletransferase